jgi:hypothetical protein
MAFLALDIPLAFSRGFAPIVGFSNLTKSANKLNKCC